MNSYAIYQMVAFPMTLNEQYACFQGYTILWRCYLEWDYLPEVQLKFCTGNALMDVFCMLPRKYRVLTGPKDYSR